MAIHQSTKAQTPEEMVKNAPKPATHKVDETEEILRDPEARKQWQEMLQRQVEGWIHTKIPILGGKTPLQAVLDPDGKEIVEALWRKGERGADRHAFPGNLPPRIGTLRRSLKSSPAGESPCA